MHISYSQLNLWNRCQYQWYLKYVKKIKKVKPSINTMFGTAMHETIQEYLSVMYKEGCKNADKLNLHKILKKNIAKIYRKDKKNNNGENFSTTEELNSIYKVGIKLLDEFKKKRGKYFPKRGWELFGVETKLNINYKEHVLFVGSLDVVIKNKKSGEIIIYDIKTSKYGWTKKEKFNPIKRSQLLLYKYFFSKQYNVPIDKIKIVFFILKKYVYQNDNWTISRLQKYEPPSGKVTMNKAIKLLDEFVDNSIDDNGFYKIKYYDKTKNKSNCNFCPYKYTDDCDVWKVEEKQE